ncbi:MULTISPECIES: 3-phenylpropionate/cinnamic acid dioxygenase subunit beta [Natrialba]|uniref:3-phenylpropionate/cinnamic acid dioxygenase subunit beta n=1 Tax=Natrialba swarupiae TaxID=2448032 RepID=A0A5D5ARY7_9EURY|nr:MULTISPECIES: 3-phenylpropionate/cinnamic acid dioxygenase subunit beta [Natrialba]MCW8173577.1 3-phenylpropionate/cinnamic acid dioxygenase subunit beta [Natrialba swarupiae]MWV38455.1 3-phenylpropionate/cinnamic acid dioxygenase subunit beta [Natrialba sp. INN-245]TYT62592.1 3-phenylpropionate/cinnamic acid dioxygenase subunit beta [Natrialba swarupiae]
MTHQSELERHYECVSFYNREAELLDEKELEHWLELLTEDIRYDMPLRVTRDRGSDRSEFSEEGFNYREDRSTLEARVERFQSEFAWSEDPPTRTRHFVTNVRVADVDGDELSVKNNLLLFMAQGEEADGTTVSAERHDVLRRVDGELKLAERDIRLDHTVLPMKNISVFF